MKLFTLTFFLILSTQWTVAQSDTTITPQDFFQGKIGYSLSYQSSIGQEVSAFLPDSMEMIIGKEWLMCRYFGGISDSLMNELLWNMNTGKLLLIAPVSRQYFTLAKKERPKTSVKKRTRTAKIAGAACREYDIYYSGTDWSDEYWLADSLTLNVNTADSMLQNILPFMVNGMWSLPLKSIRKGKTGTTTTKAVSIEWYSPDSDLFKIPEDFERVPFSASRNQRYPIIKQ